MFNRLTKSLSIKLLLMTFITKGKEKVFKNLRQRKSNAKLIKSNSCVI
jgi:hypothetical protein